MSLYVKLLLVYIAVAIGSVIYDFTHKPEASKKLKILFVVQALLWPLSVVVGFIIGIMRSPSVTLILGFIGCTGYAIFTQNLQWAILGLLLLIMYLLLVKSAK